MKYSTIKICLYISATLLIMYGMTYFSTTRQLPNGKTEEGLFINDWGLKYPSTATFFIEKSLDANQLKSLDSIVDNINTTIGDGAEDAQKIPDFTKIDTSKIQRLSYPKDAETFINKLKANLQSPQCRIIHYGDSQIEGDRMSAYIRNRLQGHYG